jgi:SNF2 family DNA or RNA helicase
VDGEKAIVFSQWAEMLDIVGEALAANHIRFAAVANKGKDFSARGPVARFKADPDIRVLLLPLQVRRAL